MAKACEWAKRDISARVVVVKGDKYQVKIEGESNVIEALATEVKDGTLEIRFPFLRDVRMTGRLLITVTTPGELSEVGRVISGAATWRSTNTPRSM